jgi:hypothetical protein
MAVGKCPLAFGLFLALDLARLFGPGPLVPGLGSFFDWILMVAGLLFLAVPTYRCPSAGPGHRALTVV